MKQKPLILISNDDSVSAKGINELIRFLRPMADLVVMAPDSPRSGSGCSVSIAEPVHYELVRQEPGVAVYKCTGTPTDCVKLAFHTVLPRRPDLVIGGINHGDNSSINMHYSGTMGIVVEGCLKGIPSIGFSLCNHGADADFSPTEPYIKQIVGQVLEKGLPPLTCLNVNFPDTPQLKGVRVCQQSKGFWVNEWENLSHRGDKRYYWISGNFELTDADNERSDHWALDHGYVAITPTTVDVTDYGIIDELQSWFKAPLNPPKGGTSDSTYNSNISSPFGGVEGAGR